MLEFLAFVTSRCEYPIHTNAESTPNFRSAMGRDDYVGPKMND